MTIYHQHFAHPFQKPPVPHTPRGITFCLVLWLLTLAVGALSFLGRPSVALADDPMMRVVSPENPLTGGACPQVPPNCHPSVCNLECFSCDARLKAAEGCAPPPVQEPGQWAPELGECNAACGQEGSRLVSHRCELDGTQVDNSRCIASQKPSDTRETCYGPACNTCVKADVGHVDSEKRTWGQRGRFGEYILKDSVKNSGAALNKCLQGFPAGTWCDSWGKDWCCGSGASYSHMTLDSITIDKKPTWDCEPWCKCN
jgi:hypothetical protein